jgi:hypothetical protein
MNEDEEVLPLPPNTGAAIREYLLRKGIASPYDFYRAYRVVKPNTSYDSVRRYFYFARKLGLIEFAGEEPGSRGGFPKRLYRLAPGAEDDPRWWYLQIACYPITGLGGRHGRRYRKFAEEGRLEEGIERVKRVHRLE